MNKNFKLKYLKYKKKYYELKNQNGGGLFGKSKKQKEEEERKQREQEERLRKEEEKTHNDTLYNVFLEIKKTSNKDIVFLGSEDFYQVIIDGQLKRLEDKYYYQSFLKKLYLYFFYYRLHFLKFLITFTIDNDIQIILTKIFIIMFIPNKDFLINGDINDKNNENKKKFLEVNNYFRDNINRILNNLDNFEKNIEELKTKFQRPDFYVFSLILLYAYYNFIISININLNLQTQQLEGYNEKIIEKIKESSGQLNIDETLELDLYNYTIDREYLDFSDEKKKERSKKILILEDVLVKSIELNVFTDSYKIIYRYFSIDYRYTYILKLGNNYLDLLKFLYNYLESEENKISKEIILI